MLFYLLTFHSVFVICTCRLERKPTADQQLTNELDQLLADLDEFQKQLTNVQQEPLPADVPQATNMISRYEVLCVLLGDVSFSLDLVELHQVSVLDNTLTASFIVV